MATSPAARSSSAVNAVTVVLPFEPVIARTRRQRAGEELYVADQLDSPCHRGANSRRFLGEPGADDDHLRVCKRRVGNRSGRQPDLRQLGAQLRRARRIGARVGHSDAGAAPRHPARGRQSGDTQAEHDNVAILERHR